MKRVLITNDDGVSSQSVAILAEAFCEVGEVIVVAPDSERSCSSHSLTLNSTIKLTKAEKKEKYLEVAISGTPVDCVKFGIQKYGDFDIIVSGINNGGNIGYHLFYSGTVAAAMEGAMYNIPSMALSMEISFGRPDYAFAAKYSVNLAKKLFESPLPKGSALNVNFPDISQSEINGTLVTHQGDFRFDDIFEKQGEVYKLAGNVPPHVAGKSSDLNALREGFVSITPIQTDLTNHHLYRSLKHLEIEL